MSSLIIHQLPLLELLTKANAQSRKKILVNCDDNLIKAIVECVHNVLKNNIEFKPERIKRLKKHKKTLRQIGHSPHKNINTHKKLIVQSGGSFLPILLAPIVSYLFEQILPSK